MAEENVPLPTVSPDALRVGLYVFIDLPWFEHPFALNQFKIITPQQIEQLRKLPVTHFRYDPDKSEPEESAEGLPGEAAPGAGAPFGRAVARPVQYGLRPVDEAPRLRNLSAYQRHVLSVEENFEATLNVVDELGRHLLNKPALMLPKMAVLVESMVNEFLSLPDVTLRVMGEIGGGGRYAHELNVSILSMMLGQRLGLSAESIADLGQGAMLHDIGLSKVPSAVRLKMPAEMSAPERELYEQHCLYGLEIGQWLNLPQTTLDIIARHHEMMDGSGFPQGLNDPATMPLDARIVGMVNFFDNLVNPRTPSRAVTPHVALSYMFAKAKNKFDAAAISALIKTLGVYPPGSLVQLSDRRLGMVTAANPASPMRPIVMLYDEARPRHRAESLDLSKEPKITIIKAFNPASLPSTISAWLNPGRRISYFFDAGAAAAPS